jgi:hypothetical protein
MMKDTFLYIGSAVIVIWGIAHIIPTRAIVNSFKPVSKDNEKIITMEWIAEGLTLCFIGVLVLLVTISRSGSNQITVYLASATMLIVTAGLTATTGARTSIIPVKICPFVKTAVAILFILGSIL